MNNLTALVLTYNEQENIQRTLAAIAWVKKVIVVDSYSTDATLELAGKYPNVTIVQRPFDNHTAQWNFGLEQIETDWVLSLDADYIVSPGLEQEILGLTAVEEISGYLASFEYRIFGHPLRASVYPPRVVLYRRARARYIADGHTQLLKVDGKIGQLNSLIYHDDRKALTRWLQAQDSYARLEADHLVKANPSDLKLQDRLRLAVYFAPAVMLVYLLFGRGLIFDGWRGWYYVAQRVIAEFLLSMRLIERKKLK